MCQAPMYIANCEISISPLISQKRNLKLSESKWFARVFIVTENHDPSVMTCFK